VGPCNWEVTPKDEWCNPNAAQENDDEDCDGISNEGGQNCICGDSFLSVEEGEQCDDGDTKDGDSCSANCMREWALPVTGYEHTCALLYNKSIKCWGISYLGQLGLGANDDIGDQDNEMGEKLPTVDLAGAPSVAVAAGRFHTCALTNLGEVKCWGRNDDCELGDGDLMDAQGDEPGEMGIALEYVPLANFTATAIDAGVDYSCALSNIGDVTCWGSNFYGNLGLGSDESFKCAAQSVVDLEQKAMAISAGDLHACAILVDGSVKCWGDNSSGKLGIGDTERRGDDPGEMGESLPTVHLGTSKKAIAIAAGLHHTCAILEDGSVKCWGSNMGGKLGIGYDSGFDQGDEPGEMEKLPTVNLGAGKTAVAIAAGGYHTCAILNDASVKCWGHNQWGQLGLGHTDSVGEKQDDMGDNLPTIDLGTGKKATAITAGGGHTCVQFNNGSVKCWGWGIDGILGLGDTENRGDAPGEMGDNLPTVKLFSSVW
jgi:cysteine-rich repeat protein